MFSLHEPPLFARLRDARRILVAGAGGGFDVYAGLPLAIALLDRGKDVHFANLSFSSLYGLPSGTWLDDDVAAVTPETESRDAYFPEGALARWLDRNGLPSTVHAFPKLGVRPLREAYGHLVDRLGLDAIVLVDGGTDILLRGDEAGLGTPEEDMAGLAALARDGATWAPSPYRPRAAKPRSTSTRWSTPMRRTNGIRASSTAR